MITHVIEKNPDLKKLRDEGYEIEVSGGYLIIHHIPYLNSQREVMFGKLVTEMQFIAKDVIRYDGQHVIKFAGEFPCNINGGQITGIAHTVFNSGLGGVNVSFTFSNKPKSGFTDYYHKMTHYIDIIGDQARAINPKVTAKTFKQIVSEEDTSVFNYIDTNSSRANIDIINAVFTAQKIAIIGLGGTGSYILDFVAKTQVSEIHLYDEDDFFLHNAFRSPGAAAIDIFEEKLKKVDYLQAIYSKMHRHIILHPYSIGNNSLHELTNMSYVFICIDKNGVKKEIIEFLLAAQIPFIDVGIGLGIRDNKLHGLIRVTTGSSTQYEHLKECISFSDEGDNAYASNIQIAELNALNATLAVIKWKQMCGFYSNFDNEPHYAYMIT